MAEDDCAKPICMDNPYGSLRRNLGPLHDNQCPLDKQELGRASWSVLHTFGAYYPESPTPEDKQSMRGILLGFKNLYPCTHCRRHFSKDYERDPPSLDSNRDVNLWLCRQHNYVNKMLGKGQFDCDYEKIMKRWKTGCDADRL